MPTEKDQRKQAVDEAKVLLNALAECPDGADPEDLLRRAKVLRGMSQFRYARQLLAYAFRRPVSSISRRREIGQQYALCTYKDVDLPLEGRLDRALEILEGTDSPALSADPETLGIAGAIHRRRWQMNGASNHLERSLRCYKRGHEISMQSVPLRADSGYPGINAAFVLDLLAAQNDDGLDDPIAISSLRAERRGEAVTIRQELLAKLGDNPPADAAGDWWYLATMAEAAIGAGDFVSARAWLQRAHGSRPSGAGSTWEYESFASQLAELGRLRHVGTATPIESTAAWRVIAEFLRDDASALRSVVRGKVGLALSGGGFRASFFHIGVLARLAEMDALRHVEVLSCVSGGSIVGAHYYLMLRELIQTRSDEEITRADYLSLVERLAADFLAGVQSNLRMRALAELSTSLQLVFRPHYTRTRRLGELYEKHLYARVGDGNGKRPRWLRDLFIFPKCDPKFTNPREANWRRTNKVPILVLNATTLNTGHNWQFTASWMGEPPIGIDREVDGNERLRRVYYEDAPARYKAMRLGHAVAASACVPGLFEPLTLAGLYVDDEHADASRTVRLVDGGAHDNQGVSSLFEQDCTVLLVSDASGQMGTQHAPRADNLGVLLRAASISQERVRVSEFHELGARRRAAQLRGFMFIHLKKDLDVVPVPWLGCTEPLDTDGSDGGRAANPVTNYGIRKDMQRRLAAVRTDLDSFNETEAYALMLDGYRMASHEVNACLPDMESSKARQRWPFHALETALSQADASATPAQVRLGRLLDVARSVPFKVWRQRSIGLLVACLTTGVIALIVTLLIVRFDAMAHHRAPVADVRVWRDVVQVAEWLTGALLAASIVWGGVRLVGFKESLSQVTTGIGLGLIGVATWPLARLHLHVFDPVYKWEGRVKRVLRDEYPQHDADRTASPSDLSVNPVAVG